MSGAPITEELLLRDQADVIAARQRARDLAATLGFSLIRQTKLVTAVSELGRNTVVHGGGGTVQINVIDGVAAGGVRMVFSDTGPGIVDVEQALVEGWSSGDGLGLGLSGSRRLVDEFDLHSSDAGTTVTIAVWNS